MNELIGRINFYIKKLSGHGWLMPNTVQTLEDACDALGQAQERIDKLESALIDLRRDAGHALNPPPPQKPNTGRDPLPAGD